LYTADKLRIQKRVAGNVDAIPGSEQEMVDDTSTAIIEFYPKPRSDRACRSNRQAEVDWHVLQSRFEPSRTCRTYRPISHRVLHRTRQPAKEIWNSDDPGYSHRADVGGGVDQRREAAEPPVVSSTVQPVELTRADKNLDVCARLVHQCRRFESALAPSYDQNLLTTEAAQIAVVAGV
jgi:hypothetical protein